jgi:6-phosphogluconate dehydrogenase
LTTERPMQLGMVGLGRMGGNLVRRLMRDGHECVGYDVSPDAVEQLESDGAKGADSIEDLASKLRPPRNTWLMVPAGEITGRLVSELADVLEPGDVIVDGGNTYYRDDIRRSEELAAKGIDHLDCGTSGGVFGLERGFCLTVGGSREVFDRLEPLFRTLAPGVKRAERTPGRSGQPAMEEQGYLYCGSSGAGHFVKMVHNGIEYGLMAAYAEGLNILRHANAGAVGGAVDAETAPLDQAEFYRYELDIPAISEVWRRGSVVSSWLLDLAASAFQESGDLEGFEGRVSDSGEGRWTAIAAIEEGVPADVLTAALYSRFSSRGEAGFANQVLSAMRKQFGGHAEPTG